MSKKYLLVMLTDFPLFGGGEVRRVKKEMKYLPLGLFDMRGENTPSLCVVVQITSVLLIS